MNPYVYVSFHGQGADREFARDLITRLKARNISVFDPESDIFPGDNWAKKVGRALEHADIMIVILSPRALRSPHVQDEIGHALTTKRFQGRFIPVEIQRLKPSDLPPWMDAVRRVDATSHPGAAAEEVVDTVLERGAPIKKRQAS